MSLSPFPPSGGALGPYLVGFLEERVSVPDDVPWELEVQSSVYLINPTAEPLDYVGVMFTEDGVPFNSLQSGAIPPNGFTSFRMAAQGRGAVKIVSLAKGLKRPKPGLIGFVRRTFHRKFAGQVSILYQHLEVPLTQLPNEALTDGELEIILEPFP